MRENLVGGTDNEIGTLAVKGKLDYGLVLLARSLTFEI